MITDDILLGLERELALSEAQLHEHQQDEDIFRHILLIDHIMYLHQAIRARIVENVNKLEEALKLSENNQTARQ